MSWALKEVQLNPGLLTPRPNARSRKGQMTVSWEAWESWDKTPVKLIKEAVARIGSDKICGIIMNRGERRDWNRYHYNRYYRENTQGSHPG